MYMLLYLYGDIAQLFVITGIKCYLVNKEHKVHTAIAKAVCLLCVKYLLMRIIPKRTFMFKRFN